MSYCEDKNEYYERISKHEWKDLDTGNIHNALEFEYNKSNNHNKCIVPGLESYYKTEINEMNKLILLENILKILSLRNSFTQLKKK